ncbi:short-chain dehydrogenase/reductase SDR [Pelagophyceae sp. CCMP2097]|nr:short-chain dehydrogenase/reductase SDR [Pelagophyceae sp. CCMP2097]
MSFRRVLVTGATSGIGKAIALKYAASGCAVVLTGRREALLEQVAEEARKLGAPRVDFVVGDVSDPRTPALLAAHGRVDVLVNNAGLALGASPAEKCSLEDWKKMIDVNITGLVAVTHAMLPAMVDAGTGHVINLSSVAANWPYPGGNVYGATKSFVQQFSLGLRADLAGKGVRVCSVEPGLTETEFSVVRFSGDAEKAKSLYAGTQPLRGEDIAETVHWITELAPKHMNVNTIELMPECQAFGQFNIVRKAA